jgi:hypothetical protein
MKSAPSGIASSAMTELKANFQFASYQNAGAFVLTRRTEKALHRKLIRRVYNKH